MAQTSMGSSSCIHLEWTQDEDRIIEYAIAHMNNKSIAFLDELVMRLPGKTTTQVVSRYLIKGGLVNCFEDNVCPTPSLPKVEGEDVVVLSEKLNTTRLRSYSNPCVWSPEEHKLFLIGVSVYGKGKWDIIYSNCVKTKTGTQVASHAQKFFENLEKPKTKSSRGPRSVFDIHTIEECDRLISESRNNDLGEPSDEISTQTSIEVTTVSSQVIPYPTMSKRKRPIVAPTDSENVVMSHQSQQPLSFPHGQVTPIDVDTPPLPPGFETNTPATRDSSYGKVSEASHHSNVFANLLAQSSLRAASSGDGIHLEKRHHRRNTTRSSSLSQAEIKSMSANLDSQRSRTVSEVNQSLVVFAKKNNIQPGSSALMAQSRQSLCSIEPRHQLQPRYAMPTSFKPSSSSLMSKKNTNTLKDMPSPLLQTTQMANPSYTVAAQVGLQPSGCMSGSNYSGLPMTMYGGETVNDQSNGSNQVPFHLHNPNQLQANNGNNWINHCLTSTVNAGFTLASGPLHLATMSDISDGQMNQNPAGRSSNDNWRNHYTTSTTNAIFTPTSAPLNMATMNNISNGQTNQNPVGYPNDNKLVTPSTTPSGSNQIQANGNSNWRDDCSTSTLNASFTPVSGPLYMAAMNNISDGQMNQIPVGLPNDNNWRNHYTTLTTNGSFTPASAPLNMSSMNNISDGQMNQNHVGYSINTLETNEGFTPTPTSVALNMAAMNNVFDGQMNPNPAGYSSDNNLVNHNTSLTSNEGCTPVSVSFNMAALNNISDVQMNQNLVESSSGSNWLNHITTSVTNACFTPASTPINMAAMNNIFDVQMNQNPVGSSNNNSWLNHSTTSTINECFTPASVTLSMAAMNNISHVQMNQNLVGRFSDDNMFNQMMPAESFATSSSQLFDLSTTMNDGTPAFSLIDEAIKIVDPNGLNELVSLLTDFGTETNQHFEL